MAEPKAENIPISAESEFFENIAENLDKEKLDNICEELLMGFKSDKDSLSELEDQRKQYDPLFNLTYEPKDTPWENAASIKMPIITTAATNFASRAGINLFPADNRIVNILPVDNTQDTIQRAERVRRHMNWQLMNMPEFHSGFSKSLMMLPKDGYAFRKTYWDSNLGTVMSVPVLPQNFIVNYYTTDLKTSMRYTQILLMSVNDIKLKMKQGIYVESEEINEENTPSPDIDETTDRNKRAAGQEQPTEIDYTTPREVLEMHTFLHIGDDEIRRPFIVTIDKESRKILRIIDRRSPVTGETMHYFTNYTFIPNPNSIFGFGFGSLLLGATATINTSINQMLDAAAASNQRGGWVLKGSQMNRGDQHFTMGEFRQLSIRGDDIRKAVLPLEFAPPSQVLLSLMQFLVTFVDRFTSVTELFNGIQKSDTTATGSAIAQEEGSKMFTDIQRRVHDSFKQELKNIYNLNGLFLDQTEYMDVISEGSPQELVITADDYLDPIDIVPVSDPNIISNQQIVQKAEIMAQAVLSNPFLAQDPSALKLVMQRRLEAAQINQADIKQFSEIMDINIESANQQQNIQLDETQAALQQEQAELEGQLQAANA